MDDFGLGVSRVLQTDGTQYTTSIWQQDKPPLDSELNLQQALAVGMVRSAVLAGTPSGFLGSAVNPQCDFVTDPTWSNFFRFGVQLPGELRPVIWANVNGYLIPVAGTRTRVDPGIPKDDDYSNVIALDPAPSGDSRIDFVYLEVWRARLEPDPSTDFKPSHAAVWKYGNIEGGFTPIADEMIDPALGFETNERVQLQYAIRVLQKVPSGLMSAPDGFDSVQAQGASTQLTSFRFANMRSQLGDAGLWRAGDGDPSNALDTVDGYSYALPIGAVFRRNSVAWNGNPSPNLNGSFDRNSTAVDRTGITTFAQTVTLTSAIDAASTNLQFTASGNLPFSLTPKTSVLLRIGDELVSYGPLVGQSVAVARGVNGTVAVPHAAGSLVTVQSGRPDGLFADQVAATDILDLRHIVNPNGFDARSLLEANVDRLLRGELRSIWKRGAGGPQGPFVHMQDAITSRDVASSVTKLDAPDKIRMVFSDAATVQPVECIVSPAPSVNFTDSISTGFSLNLSVTTTNSVGGVFTPGDQLILDVSQLKTGLPGGSDQVRWLNDGVAGAVTLRFEGETTDLPASMFSVTPAIPTPADSLVITLASSFPSRQNTISSPAILHIKAHVVYGPGRGLSRRPDALHSICMVGPSSDIVTRVDGVPSSNKSMNVAWAPLWSRYLNIVFNGRVPVTAEMYADLGSKSIIATPFRGIEFPNVLTIDGTAANLTGPLDSSGVRIPKLTGTGTTSGPNSVTFAGVAGSAAANDALVIASGVGAGRYSIMSVSGTTYTLDRPILAPTGSAVPFSVYSAQGVMPLKDSLGNAKYTATDPLGLFCGQSAGNAAINNIYVRLPRHMVPGWGAIYAPMVSSDQLQYSSGVNYMVRATNGFSPTASQSNYVAFFNSGSSASQAYSVFSQQTPTGTTIAYNTGAQVQGATWAGIRLFTDSRGLGRRGLELPPFYGIARLMGVYEASSYIQKGSPFNPDRTTPTVPNNGATNLLRKTMDPSDGPAMWIEIDGDLDSTFVINANAIDLSKTSLASFEAGKYVVEAVIFGFDRGSFDLNSEFRLVLTRPQAVAPNNSNGWATVAGGNVVTDPTQRSSNINKAVTGPSCILPGPADATDQILVNYSRTVYQGDPWGTQTGYDDLLYSPGMVSSSLAYALGAYPLNQTTLERPNEKPVEVLASLSFTTTLGTGRYSGDASVSPLSFLDVAHSDPDAPFPPASPTASRPLSVPVTFTAGDAARIGGKYLGCTERLPLGALFRDSSFCGQAFDGSGSPLVYTNTLGCGPLTGAGVASALDQVSLGLDSDASAMGVAGDILVHVDGDQSDPSGATTRYRVHRGGSVYVGSGPHPGGPVSVGMPALAVFSDHVCALQGRAMLVRNNITNVGGSEKSAGDELMLLVITNVEYPAGAESSITIGTNGVGEGYAAADLYRISGHPLVCNATRLQPRPSPIPLPP